MKKCKFCFTAQKKKNYIFNFKDNRLDGTFYHCKKCNIFFNNKIYKEQIYTKSVGNLNAGTKNILYYLKSIFLLHFYSKISPFLTKKKILF